jgi:hypothetical protein
MLCVFITLSSTMTYGMARLNNMRLKGMGPILEADIFPPVGSHARMVRTTTLLGHSYSW